MAFRRLRDSDAYSEVALIWHPHAASRLTLRFVDEVARAPYPVPQPAHGPAEMMKGADLDMELGTMRRAPDARSMSKALPRPWSIV